MMALWFIFFSIVPSVSKTEDLDVAVSKLCQLFGDDRGKLSPQELEVLDNICQQVEGFSVADITDEDMEEENEHRDVKNVTTELLKSDHQMVGKMPLPFIENLVTELDMPETKLVFHQQSRGNICKSGY